jgi:hypothetical protein
MDTEWIHCTQNGSHRMDPWCGLHGIQHICGMINCFASSSFYPLFPMSSWRNHKLKSNMLAQFLNTSADLRWARLKLCLSFPASNLHKPSRDFISDTCSTHQQDLNLDRVALFVCPTTSCCQRLNNDVCKPPFGTR